MESQLVNYRIVISHDCHGDITGAQLFVNDALHDQVGDCYDGYLIVIERSAYYGGAMFRLFNIIVQGADLMQA